MVTLKELKPHCVKVDANYVYVILANQYFSVLIGNYLYQYVPTESLEIQINRHTMKIENKDAIFAFQKRNHTIYIGMPELTFLPEFLIVVHTIAEPYYFYDTFMRKVDQTHDYTIITDELEQENIKRLIDKALDRAR